MKLFLTNVWKRIWADIRKYWKAAVAFLVYYLATILLFHASCPMVLCSGLPCPGCGMTRALFCVFTFRWENAFYLNPVSFGFAALILLFIIFRYFIGKTPKFLFAIFWILIALLFVRYFYGMYNWFPDRIPYVFRKKNLLHYLINLRK
ncbi:MAG: DUF2752 domain-containing protein [Lachnospiraceae bacterium]|nr:DUF2752 domain-containing protein [Lachnospiraceae bacterium]